MINVGRKEEGEEDIRKHTKWGEEEGLFDWIDGWRRRVRGGETGYWQKINVNEAHSKTCI
jgi:hypothetical protein